MFGRKAWLALVVVAALAWGTALADGGGDGAGWTADQGSSVSAPLTP